MMKKDYLHHIDLIRAAMMLLGIPFHVGLMYSVAPEWFVSSPDPSRLITYITGFITSFRMPCFFMMAGILSGLVLSRRDRTAWLRKRVFRLLVPLVTASLVLSPFVMIVLADQEVVSGNSASFSDAYFQLLSSPGRQWIGHLWFLIVLAEISFVMYLVAPWLPGFQRWLSASFADENGEYGRKIVFLFIAISAPFSFLVAGFFHAVQDLWPRGIYNITDFLFLEAFLKSLPFFLFGAVVFNRPLVAFHKDKVVLALIVLGLALFLAFYGKDDFVSKLAQYAGGGISKPLVCVVLISLTRDHFGRQNRVVRYLADASYTIYLTHYPICVLLGYYLIKMNVDTYVGYAVNISLTVLFCVLLNEIISRSAVATFLFNGIPFKKPQVS